MIRAYADRLILEKLTELFEVVKPSELSDELKSHGLGLSVVRSLLASNPHRFAYSERRWVPASRIETDGRPLATKIRVMVDRFGAPMPVNLVVAELSRVLGRDEDEMEQLITELATSDIELILTRNDHIAISNYVFKASDESIERAFIYNMIDQSETEEVEKQLGNFDWRADEAILLAVEKVAPVSVKALGAAAWKALNPQDPRSVHLYDWKAFNAELLSIPGFIAAADGVLYPESAAKDWIAITTKAAETFEATIEVEDAAPLELKKDDIEGCVLDVIKSEDSVLATVLLEEKFEVTPLVKTFPDDLANMMTALKADSRIQWVGGDRFQKPNLAPEFCKEVPLPFVFQKTEFLQEDGDPVDCELENEGLSQSLRKLCEHPLAQDVLDEGSLEGIGGATAAKNAMDSVRLVLKPIHRELGTFPMCQFAPGWFGEEPNLQELIFRNPEGQELQVWLNHDCRLLFNLFDWWLDQPIESGAVFQLTKTKKANVLDFEWLDQTDPIVYISNQRMETLREIAGRAEELSTFDILREVMTNWSKGADFLTIMWEVNVVRHTSRRMLASLLSGYNCFYQRSGSPVWHYDHKKVEQGFDKNKKKFILKG